MVMMSSAAAAEPELEAVEIEIDDGCGEEREELAENEAADDSDAERAAKFGAGAVPDGQRQCPEERSHCGH